MHTGRHIMKIYAKKERNTKYALSTIVTTIKRFVIVFERGRESPISNQQIVKLLPTKSTILLLTKDSCKGYDGTEAQVYLCHVWPTITRTLYSFDYLLCSRITRQKIIDWINPSLASFSFLWKAFLWLQAIAIVEWIIE